MVPGSHLGSSYSEGEEAGPVIPRGWLVRLWHLVRPPLPEPLTAASQTPTPVSRRSPLDHLRPEDVRAVRFGSSKLREGYDQDEVDAFLDRVELRLRGSGDLQTPSMTADDVVNQRFSATKFRPGYDQDDVDDFLDRIVTELRRQQQ